MFPFDVGDVTGDGTPDLYLYCSNAVVVGHGRTFDAPVAISPYAKYGVSTQQGALFMGAMLAVDGDSTKDIVLPLDTGYAAVLFNAPGHHGW